MSDFHTSVEGSVFRRGVIRIAAMCALVSAVVLVFAVPPERHGGATAGLRALRTAIDSLRPGGTSEAAEAVRASGAVGLAAVAMALFIAAMVALLVIVPAFRQKRMLFNLGPLGDDRRAWTVPASHARRAEGVYVEESKLFESLEMRPPREFPWDLMPGLLLCLSLLALMGAAWRDEFSRPSLWPRWFGVMFWACFIVPLLAWGNRIRAAWSARHHPAEPEPFSTPAWLRDAADQPGTLTLDGDRLTFRAHDADPTGDDAAAAGHFAISWMELVVAHVRNSHAFGQGLVLMTTAKKRYELTFVPPTLAGVTTSLGWCLMFTSLALIALSAGWVSVWYPMTWVAVLARSLHRGGVNLANAIRNLSAIRIAWRSTRRWKDALGRWP